MSNKDKRFRSLLVSNRDRRQIKRDICLMEERELKGQLIINYCSIDGDISVLRHRLLRCTLKKLEPDNEDIPWYEDDVVNEEMVERFNKEIEEFEKKKKELKEMKELNNKDKDKEKELNNYEDLITETTDNEEEMDELLLTIPSLTRVSTPTTTIVATTQVHLSTSTNVVASNARPLSLPVQSHVEVNKTPRITFDTQVNQQLGFHPNQYEYFATNIIRNGRTLENPSSESEDSNNETGKEVWTTPLQNMKDLRTANKKINYRKDNPERLFVETVKVTMAKNKEKKKEQVDQEKRKVKFNKVEYYDLEESELESSNEEEAYEERKERKAHRRQIKNPEKKTEIKNKKNNTNEDRRQCYPQNNKGNFRARNEKSNKEKMSKDDKENSEESDLNSEGYNLRIRKRNRENNKDETSDEEIRCLKKNQVKKSRKLKRRETSEDDSSEDESHFSKKNKDKKSKQKKYETSEDESSDEEVHSSKKNQNRRIRKPKQKKYETSEDESSNEEYYDSSEKNKKKKVYKTIERTCQATKFIKDWGVKFLGEEKNEDPEEILELLEDFKSGVDLTDREFLNALPIVFKKQAGRWYRTTKNNFKTWKDFKRAFKNQYIGEYDREDLMDDLRNRSQGKGEKVTNYLTSLRYILSRFDKLPSVRSQVDLAYRNLLPEYRKAMSEKIVETLEDIEDYGRKWERQLELDKRYTAPPPPERMRVKGAAFLTNDKDKYSLNMKSKVNSVEEEKIAVMSSNKNPKPNQRNNQAKFNSVKPKNQDLRQSEKENINEEVKEASAVNENYRLEYRNTNNDQFKPKPQYNRPVGNNFGGYENKPNFKTKDKDNGINTEFLSVCYKCQAVGHKASHCMETICYACNQRGHLASECPNRASTATKYKDVSKSESDCYYCHKPGHFAKHCFKNPNRIRESCQVCNRPGVTFNYCPSLQCEKFRDWNQGNAKGGE